METITGQLDAEEIGVRLTLRIAWGDAQRRLPPLSLVAWVLPARVETVEAIRPEDSP